MENKTPQTDNYGWVSIHRKIINNPIFDNSNGLKVWIWCLIKANRYEKEVLLGRNKILLKSGQFVFGSNTACEQLKMSKSTIHFWMSYLKVERYIERKTTNRYSIITILNYIKYQIIERQIERQRNASETPIETNNKKNMINKDNKRENTFSYLKNIPEEDLIRFSNTYACNKYQIKTKAESLLLWLEKKGRAYKNYRAGLQDCLLKDFGKRSIKKEIIIPKGVEVIERG